MDPTEAPRPGLMLFGSFFPAPIQPHAQPPPPPEPQEEPIQGSADDGGAPKRRRTEKTQKQRATKRRVSKPLPERLKPAHIFSRALFQSDVDNKLKRLTIPRNQILKPFLTDQEEAQLRDLKPLNVAVVDSRGVRTLRLTRWNYKSSSPSPAARSYSYALTGGWMNIVRGNGFVEGDVIHVWSFRIVNGDLGFIIFKQTKDSQDLGKNRGNNS